MFTYRCKNCGRISILNNYISNTILCPKCGGYTLTFIGVPNENKKSETTSSQVGQI